MKGPTSALRAPRPRARSFASLLVLGYAAAFLATGTSMVAAAPVTGGCVKEVSGFGDVPGCGSNDVSLTDIVAGSVVILDDGCTSPSDTVTFTAQGIFALNASSSRFDLGVFVSTDGDPDGNGAKAGACARDTIPAAPNPPYVSLDGDSCGDLDSAHSPLTQSATSPIGPFTIQCVDANGDGKVDIYHCETWNTSGSNSVCNSAADIAAGNPAKCNCGTLPALCIAVSDGNPCTQDICQGACSNNAQQTCQRNSDCSGGGTCQNIQPANVPLPAGTACGDQSSSVCDLPNTCDAHAVCQPNYRPATTVCRAANGVCDVAETCTGTSVACPSDAKSTAVCRAAAGVCDFAEVCDGVSNTCPADAKSTAVCRTAAGVCDVAESCDGSGNDCPADAKSTAVCRAAAGVCDVAESCNGVDDGCPVDVKSTAVCRAAAGACDVAESCDGVGNDCPADGKSTALCRAAAGVCDLAESCDGSGNDCPSDTKSTAVCRPAAGVCDVAESCDGSGNDCGADTKSTGVCRAAAGVCDAAESCDGAGNDCPADAKLATVCRAAAGVCDVDDSCDGETNDCPADAVKPSGVVCNAGSGDACDPDEVCDGSGTACPADTMAPSGTVCRAGSGDACDPDEVCTGSAGTPCPADTVRPATVICRAGSGDACDPDEFCPGVPGGTCAADVVEPTTLVCRSGSGDACDPDEHCPGIPGGSCAADIVAPVGTVCRPGSGDLCDPAETCSGMAGDACPDDVIAPASMICRGLAGVCDVAEHCPGTPGSGCPADGKQASGTICRAAVDACDQAESCNGIANTCPADAKQPDGTSCEDGSYCNGAETCRSGQCTDNADPCVFVCDEVHDVCVNDACPAGPQPSCRTAQKSILIIKDKADNTKDKLVWKYIKGASTSFNDFSNPMNTSDYTLCIYSGAADTLVGTVNIGRNASRWKVLGNNKGYKYKDKSGASDGVQKALMKSSATNKSKAKVKGKGINLPGVLGADGLEMPVTVQLLNHGTGICWESDFHTAKKNTASKFKAKQ